MSGWTYVSDIPGRDADTEGGARAEKRTRSAVAAVEDLGSVVAGRYVIKSYLGEGRYGAVYMAVDRSLSDPQIEQEHSVALHLLHDRISQQVNLLQKLEDTYRHPHLWAHPNVVKVRGFGSDRGRYFLVTELLAGVSLRSILEESPHELLSESEAFAVLRGVGDALKYAHAKGAIHGDIRPERIFITEDYAVKVLDLLPTIPDRTVPFFVEDSEKNGLAPPDQRDDVYGLSCVAYELFAGRHPFNANSPLEALNAGLTLAPITGMSARRWNALARGLALRREHRTASVAAFLADLGVTGDEKLRPAKGSASGSRSAAPPDDDPIVGDYHDAAGGDALPTAPLEPPPRPPQQHAAFASGEMPRRAARDPDFYTEFTNRRERRPPPRSGLKIATVAVVAAAIGVAGYWQRDELQTRAAEWLVQAREFVANASRAPSESAPAEDAEPPLLRGDAQDAAGDSPVFQDEVPAAEGQAAAAEGQPAPVDGEARVVAPPIATVPPAARSDARVAPSDGGAAPSGAATGAAAAAVAGEAAEPEPTVPPAPPEPRAVANAADRSAANAATPAAVPPRSAEPETIEFAAPTVTLNEGDAVATIVIRRRGGNLGESSFAWWTSDGSARADDDYANLGARIERFAAGEQTRTIRVPIVVDSLIERRENFYVNVRAGEQSGRRSEPAQRIEVVILDDD